MASYSQKSYFVIPQDDGTLRLAGAGDLPAGTIINGLTQITVEGPGWDGPSKEPMTQSEFEAWKNEMEAKGFSISETIW